MICHGVLNYIDYICHDILIRNFHINYIDYGEEPT
jgi:hypothetical protein